ncbi:VIR-like CYIR protein, partial [Plasmodium cynomolgi strain B]
MGDFTGELWGKVLEDSPLYKELSDNVSKPSEINDECKTLNITCKKISNELCNKVAKNLQHVYGIKDVTDHNNTCDNYKYWIFYQMWKLIGSKKNDALAKDVMEDFLKVQTIISKKHGKNTCQYYFVYNDYDEFEEILEKANLKHYFKNYTTIKNNASSKDKYDVYHKYVPYIKNLYDKYYKDCSGVNYYYYDCKNFFERESEQFNPKNLLPLLETAKAQAVDAKIKETVTAVHSKGQGLSTPGGGDGSHSKSEKLSADSENPAAGGLAGKDQGSLQQTNSTAGTAPSDVSVQVKKPESAHGSSSSFNPFNFWGYVFSSPPKKSAHLDGQGQKAPKEPVPPAKGKVGETAESPLKSAPAPKAIGTDNKVTTGKEVPEPTKAAPAPAKPEPEIHRPEVSETIGTLHDEAPLSSLPIDGAEQGVHVAKFYNPELARSEVPLTIADTPNAVGTTHEAIDSNFFHKIIMAVAVLGTICFLFYYNRVTAHSIFRNMNIVFAAIIYFYFISIFTILLHFYTFYF